MAERNDGTKLRLWTAILVFGVGVSSIGDFIYLVALNLFVWNETHSAAAVAGLWVVSRIAALLVGPWAGSVTDRLPHRKQLIGLEITRAVLIGILPLLSDISLIYLILFLLGICSTFFGNAFLPYQTTLIPKEHRKRVNSIISTLKYGAFLIGPAIAGVFLAHGETAVALWLDAVSFLVSGITLFLLPNFPALEAKSSGKRAWLFVQEDWREALGFLRNHALFTSLFSLNAGTMILALTADSQEVVFAQDALGLGEFGYGMMVVAAGVGAVSGSFILAWVAKYLKNEVLIGAGQFFSAIGYLIYALSHNFWWAVAGLVVLGLFGSAANVGFTTYVQHTVPVSRMGRINNVFGPLQQIFSIIFILCGGFAATAYGVRSLMIAMTLPMCSMGLIMAILVFVPQNRLKVSEAGVSHTKESGSS
ncbi:MAG TPA: MFS transporter [Bacillales bacterium]